MRPVIRMHACDYDRSAAHGAQWQELELIFGWLLQHGNMRERRERVAHVSLRPAETFMHACCRPTEAAHFRVQKCANNHQLIVSSVERFLRHACAHCAAHFHVIHTRKTPCALRNHWSEYFSNTETVTCMSVLHEDEICFTSMDAIFKRS